VSALIVNGVAHDLARLHVINPTTHKPVNYRTFRNAFASEIETANTLQLARVTMNLFRIATGGSAQAASAAQFWLRCKGGWRPAEIEDVTPPLDPPQTFSSEEEVAAHVKALVERYGRRSRTT
jgi:hypothetical protein